MGRPLVVLALDKSWRAGAKLRSPHLLVFPNSLPHGLQGSFRAPGGRSRVSGLRLHAPGVEGERQ